MWKINFDHFTNPVGFATCSELQAVAQTYRYAEGGDMIGEEFVAGFEFNDLTIERGFDQDPQLSNWWKEICKVKRQVGALPSQYKHDGELILLNLDGTEGPRWDILRGFMKEYKAAGGMDAGNKTAPIMQSAVIGMKKWEEE
jgi:phage tail-like protein